MANDHRTAFDLLGTYAHLGDGGGAAIIPVTPVFWEQLMSGEARDPDVRRVAEEGGWLVSAYHISGDMQSWEMHPEGDEILYMLSGAVDIVMEEQGATRTIELRAGTACLVPRGAWHRQIVRTPGELLALTYGRGTQHRPL